MPLILWIVVGLAASWAGWKGYQYYTGEGGGDPEPAPEEGGNAFASPAFPGGWSYLSNAVQYGVGHQRGSDRQGTATIHGGSDAPVEHGAGIVGPGFDGGAGPTLPAHDGHLPFDPNLGYPTYPGSGGGGFLKPTYTPTNTKGVLPPVRPVVIGPSAPAKPYVPPGGGTTPTFR